MQQFNFLFYGNIAFGKGAINSVYEIIEKENYSNLGIVVDTNIIELPAVAMLIKNLKKDAHLTIVKCDISEPTYEKLEEKRLGSDNIDIDVLIGIGGGSALDMAKGLSVLYSNHGPAIAYRGFDVFKNIIPPIIAVPTTAGTGSEITPNASFIDTVEKRKLGINGEAIRPKYAILDPELTLTCPEAPTISAGIDSLVHATEAFVAKKSNPMAKMFAKEGLKIVIENLPLLVEELDNIELREKVMYGAFLSAIALMNSGTGPAAAMSYPLGVHYGVPHGIGGGVFLPHVIEHNINHGYYEYGDLYGILNSSKNTKKEKSILFLSLLRETWLSLNVPPKLNPYGLTRDGLSEFVANTMDLKSALDQNPLPFLKENVIKTFYKLVE